MRKAVLLVAALVPLAATLLLARLWLQRLALPYNEQGRYFDAAQSVVHDEGAVIVYGLLTALLALVSAGTLWWASRAWPK